MQQETADPLLPSTCPAPRSSFARYCQQAWAGLKRHPLSLLLLLTCLVRGGVLYARFDQLQADPDAYRRLAETLVATGVYGNPLPLSRDVPQPTAFRPPLYPFLLAALAQQGQVTSACVALLHGACGLLTVAMVYWLTQFVCHPPQGMAAGRSTRLPAGASLGPFLAGLGTVIDPLLLNQSTLVMTETLAATLATTCLFLLSWWMLRFVPLASSISPPRFPTSNRPDAPGYDAPVAGSLNVERWSPNLSRRALAGLDSVHPEVRSNSLSPDAVIPDAIAPVQNRSADPAVAAARSPRSGRTGLGSSIGLSTKIGESRADPNLAGAEPIASPLSERRTGETLAGSQLLAKFCPFRKHRGSDWFTWSGSLGAISLTVASGVTLGLAILCRPTFLPWSALVLCIILFHTWRLQSRQAWAPLCGLILVLLLTVLPWGLRNAFVIGSFKLTTTHGGYTFYLANNPLFYQFLRGDPGPVRPPVDSAGRTGPAFPGVASSTPYPTSGPAEVWDATLFNLLWERQRDACVAATTADEATLEQSKREPSRSVNSVPPFVGPEGARAHVLSEQASPLEPRPLVEAPFVALQAADRTRNRVVKPVAYVEFIADRCAYRLAWQAIRSDPTMFIYSCFVRTARLWRWLPHRIQATESTSERSLRYAVFIWYGLQFSLVCVGFWKLRHRLLQPPCSLSLCLFLVFTAVHALYWSDMRMRSPLIPTLMIFAAVGAQTTWNILHWKAAEPT